MTSSALHWRAWPASITLCCWRLTPGVEFHSENPLPNLRSWTNKRGIVKSPAVFVVSSQGAVDESP